MRRLPAPAIWSITLLALPVVVLLMLLVLVRVGDTPITQAIAAFVPMLLIGAWVVSFPVGVIAIVAGRGRRRLLGLAVIVLAVLEPLAVLAIWIGSG